MSCSQTKTKRLIAEIKNKIVAKIKVKWNENVFHMQKDTQDRLTRVFSDNFTRFTINSNHVDNQPKELLITYGVHSEQKLWKDPLLLRKVKSFNKPTNILLKNYKVNKIVRIRVRFWHRSCIQ